MIPAIAMLPVVMMPATVAGTVGHYHAANSPDCQSQQTQQYNHFPFHFALSTAVLTAGLSIRYFLSTLNLVPLSRWSKWKFENIPPGWNGPCSQPRLNFVVLLRFGGISNSQ